MLEALESAEVFGVASDSQLLISHLFSPTLGQKFAGCLLLLFEFCLTHFLFLCLVLVSYALIIVIGNRLVNTLGLLYILLVT